MYRLIQTVLLRMDPERAHNLTLGALRLAGAIAPVRAALASRFAFEDARLAVEAFGVRFGNPVGLAAGYDKNGTAIQGFECLGFGHLEIGTVTLLPQAGNPKPRLHRLPEARGIINSMGFPNRGAGALERVLQTAAVPIPIGINIGKGKDTALERAADDYCALLRRFHGYAQYVTVNVSSPNTLGLRRLQARDMAESLLTAIAAQRNALEPRVPLLVKVAPDLSAPELDDAVAATAAAGFDGIVATNTTVSRDGIPARYAALKGGLSGAPLRERALGVIRHIARATGGRLPLIGVGGIGSGDDALDAIRAGAWLVQVYSGMVYAGPGLARAINARLARACAEEGVLQISDLRGTLAN